MNIFLKDYLYVIPTKKKKIYIRKHICNMPCCNLSYSKHGK